MQYSMHMRLADECLDKFSQRHLADIGEVEQVFPPSLPSPPPFSYAFRTLPSFLPSSLPPFLPSSLPPFLPSSLPLYSAFLFPLSLLPPFPASLFPFLPFHHRSSLLKKKQ